PDGTYSLWRNAGGNADACPNHFYPAGSDDRRRPEAPTTHVLSRPLRSGRTHRATEPVPEGLVPCAHLYPAHPVADAGGRACVSHALRLARQLRSSQPGEGDDEAAIHNDG